MADRELIVHIAKNDDGGYLFASSQSPFFCIEAATEEAGKAKINRLLAFYEANKHKETRPRGRVTLRAFTPSRSIRREELNAA